jgi:hypothetical protein
MPVDEGVPRVRDGRAVRQANAQLARLCQLSLDREQADPDLNPSVAGRSIALGAQTRIPAPK